MILNAGPVPDPPNQGSVIEQILDDRITIDSVEEFEALLDMFPNEPDLYRKFGDRLAVKALSEAALLAYHKAAALYLDAGMVLQSIVAKILEWSIVKPSHREGRDYHSRIRQQGGGDQPSQILFSELDYEEMIALMLRLVRVRVAAGETVIASGQEADAIHLIVSGTLSETADRPAAAAVALAENDIFGDIFPLEEVTTHQTQVVATSPTELVKISKPALKATCYRFPRIRELLERLCRLRTPENGERSWQTVRRSYRYCLPAEVQMTFDKHSPAAPQSVQGTARDLSAGGICIALETTSGDGESWLGHKTTLTLMDAGETVIAGLTGTVAWQKTTRRHSRAPDILGIAFDPMPEETAMALNAFCTICNDEQDMIWNLWNHLVRH